MVDLLVVHLFLVSIATVLVSGEEKVEHVPSTWKGNFQLDHQFSVASPYIDVVNSPNVTVALGKTALLKCRVKALANQTVSWIRHRDLHLLTAGSATYTRDPRFAPVSSMTSKEDCCALQIRNVNQQDQGVYECQVGVTPHVSHFVHLAVVEPATTVLGGPELYIDLGSTINLTCVVKHSPELPDHVFWSHDQQTVNFDSPRGGISVLTEKGETTVSSLMIQKARATDSGSYTCSPSTAPAASINVHVLHGEKPAAMQHSTATRTLHPGQQFCILLFFIFNFMLLRL